DDGTEGRIINITSVHEQTPLRNAAAYCAAKGGLGLLTKVMALELAEQGITVNSIAPGSVATPMTDLEDVDPQTVSRPRIPPRRRDRDGGRVPGSAREPLRDRRVFRDRRRSHAAGGTTVTAEAAPLPFAPFVARQQRQTPTTAGRRRRGPADRGRPRKYTRINVDHIDYKD